MFSLCEVAELCSTQMHYGLPEKCGLVPFALRYDSRGRLSRQRENGLAIPL